MSKKITSFVVLLAVMLLTLPSHAQSQMLTRKAVTDVKEMHGGKQTLNGAELVKAKAAVAKAMEAELTGTNVGNWNWAGHEAAPFVPGQSSYPRVGMELTHKPVSLVNRFVDGQINRAATTDSHGIITSPDEGEHKFYTREGTCYYLSGNQIYYGPQSGVVEVVEAADGTVYIKDIVSRYAQGSWVKGTKAGNKITVTAGQPLYYEGTQYMTTVSLYKAVETTTAQGLTYVKEDGDITFTINGDVISLDNSSEEHIIAPFWDDDDSWSGYGDYETVWTWDEDYVPPTTDLVVLPEGAEVQTWYSVLVAYNDGTKTKANASIAFVGNDVYVSGIFENFPNSWIKGTIEGTTVTFSGFQYLGAYGVNDIWAIGADVDGNAAVIGDFKMTYNAEEGTLTSTNMLFANAATDRIYYLEGFTSVALSLDAPAEPTAQTGDPVDALPYSNSLATTAEFNQFGVLDANEDGKTWSMVSGVGAAYNYNMSSAADDWLISPAIKLETGKLYHFAIDAAAYSSSYPEKFEVKLANGAAKASVLAQGQTVIAATTVTNKYGESGFVTVENEGFSVSETGYYHFGVHAISDANEWTLYVGNFFVEVGADPESPAAPTALTVTPDEEVLGATVSLTAPTKKINGKDLGANDITKIDILRDGKVINTFNKPAPGAKLSYKDNAADLTLGNHKYQAVSYGSLGVGGKTEIVTVLLTAILNVPASFDLNQKDVFSVFQVIDANNDGKTWGWDASYGTYYSYHSSNAADDYLISSGIRLEAGRMYKVTMTAHTYSETYPEKFEVLAGTAQTVAAQTIEVIPVTEVANPEFEEFEGEFIAPEDGIYYLSVHAVSDADQWRLHVGSLAIEKGPEPTAPAAPTLKLTPGKEGALFTEGKIIMPTKSINGETLASSIDSVEVLRDGEVITTFYNVARGAEKILRDASCSQGTHIYQAIPYNESGIGQKSEKLTLFVGPDDPSLVENIKMNASEVGKVTFTWDPVTVGANGGYVNPAEITYSVCKLELETVLFWTILVEGETMATVTGDNTATIDFDADQGDPDFQYFGVKATYNGASTDPTINYTAIRLGAPQELPIIENFANKTMNNVWFTSNVDLYVSEEASDDDGYALALTATTPGISTFETPKLKLAQAPNATVLFDAKKGTSTADKIDVIALTPDGETKVLKTFTLTDEYQTFKLVVPAELKSVRWSHLGFKVDFEDAATDVILDNIKILDFYEYDLSVNLDAPKTVLAGQTATVKATVKNEGENTAKGYTVTVKAGDEVLLEETSNEDLKSFETKEFTVEFAPSIFEDAADVTLTATVEYDNDLNPDNDASSSIISVTEPSVPSVSNVNAVANGPYVTVSWIAPDLNASVPEEVTEDFEEGTGGWTFVDADGDGFNWMHHINTGTANWTTHSGDGAVGSESFSNDLSQALFPDNWLISPDAVLDGTFSFWAVGQDADYAAEHFQVYVSTTSGTDVSTFEPVSQEFVATGEYKEYTVDLSAYKGVNGWIAIRHYNVTDEFVLVVDDITYMSNGGAPAEISKYNIYLDGKFVMEVAGNKATAEISNVSVGSHTVAVSVVYGDGRESKPVETAVSVTTGINSIQILTQPVDVYSVDGKLIRKQTTSFDGLKGVYVVNGKKIILK